MFQAQIETTQRDPRSEKPNKWEGMRRKIVRKKKDLD